MYFEVFSAWGRQKNRQYETTEIVQVAVPV